MINLKFELRSAKTRLLFSKPENMMGYQQDDLNCV